MKIVAAAFAASVMVGCVSAPFVDCNYKAKPVTPSLCKVAANADADGFVSLFNGKDLTGWIGATKTYGIDPNEPGVLQCFPDRSGEGGGGNLCTEKTFRNFVLRFEFSLPTNGNNGLGIRMPNANVDSAYYGMCELQLLDDGGSEYYNSKDGLDLLHAYQYTGSVYGIVPSRRDNFGVQTRSKEKMFAGGGSYVKKPGVWNFEEVRVVGSEIEVSQRRSHNQGGHIRFQG